MIKDDKEVECIRHAYEVAGVGLMQSLEQFRFGQEERMWAATLEYNMKINGARKESFDTIVASGPRGALPHGVASGKKIRADETVIIDYGAKTGYVSDITRMVYNGNDQQVLDHLKVVSDTIDIVIESIKPGIVCGEIYGIGKNYLAKYGLDKYFNHGLGHSLGIDVHEKPSLSLIDDTVIQEGMVFTVEPGVYFSDRYGIRIEETVLVKKNGCEILSSVLKDRCFKNI
jgi:Xaa-Pro aminopeptidase